MGTRAQKTNHPQTPPPPSLKRRAPSPAPVNGRFQGSGLKAAGLFRLARDSIAAERLRRKDCGRRKRHGRPRRPCALACVYAARPCAQAAPCALSGYALGTAVSGYALVIFCRLAHRKRGRGLRRAAGVLGLTPCGSAPPAYARGNYLAA